MDYSKDFINKYCQILKRNFDSEKNKTDLNFEFKENPTPNLHIDIGMNSLNIDSNNQIKKDQVEINHNDIPEDKETVKKQNFHKLFKEQNYKNGELYHIKENCENLNELDEFIESNLYLFMNDFEFDLNLRDANNKFFESFAKIDKEEFKIYDESNEHLVFFEKYKSKYNQLVDDIQKRKFVDSDFKKKLLENYMRLTNQIIKEKKQMIVDNYQMICDNFTRRKNIKIELNKEENEKLDICCQELLKQLVQNSNQLSESNMKFIEENLVRIRLYHIFFDKLTKLSDNFNNKSNFIRDLYVEIVNKNKAKIESEIIVQEKFLEYNNNIDSIVHSKEKKFNNGIKFADSESFYKPWNRNYQFYKNYFIYSNENKLFNKLLKKYSMMEKDYVIEKYVENLHSQPKITYNVWDNKIANFCKERWIKLNVRVFDSVQKRRLRKAILNEDYGKTYELIIDYEKCAGASNVTTKIKNFSIYNMINNKFVNSTILEKI